MLLFSANPWSLQQSNVCVGSRDDQFGPFELKTSGMLAGFQLVHKSGGVGCTSTIRNWGCKNNINMHITEENGVRILPTGVNLNVYLAYTLPNFTANSDVLELMYQTSQYNKARPLRAWFGEDLVNIGQSDNPKTTKSCFDVYAKMSTAPNGNILVHTVHPENVTLLKIRKINITKNTYCA